MYHTNPEWAVKGEGKVPILKELSFLSDANKIAWMRAYLGWACKCTRTGDPRRNTVPHELSASQGIVPAKPCGQGLPVYAAGKEMWTGEEGVSTSDWGNETFVAAA